MDDARCGAKCNAGSVSPATNVLRGLRPANTTAAAPSGLTPARLRFAPRSRFAPPPRNSAAPPRKSLVALVPTFAANSAAPPRKRSGKMGTRSWLSTVNCQLSTVSRLAPIPPAFLIDSDFE
jgi:hypothetical protein